MDGGVVVKSEFGGCVEVVAAALLVEVSFEPESGGIVKGSTGAAEPEDEAYGWGIAFAVIGDGPVASAIDAGAGVGAFVLGDGCGGYGGIVRPTGPAGRVLVMRCISIFSRMVNSGECDFGI